MAFNVLPWIVFFASFSYLKCSLINWIPLFLIKRKEISSKKSLIQTHHKPLCAAPCCPPWGCSAADTDSWRTTRRSSARTWRSPGSSGWSRGRGHLQGKKPGTQNPGVQNLGESLILYQTNRMLTLWALPTLWDMVTNYQGVIQSCSHPGVTPEVNPARLLQLDSISPHPGVDPGVTLGSSPGCRKCNRNSHHHLIPSHGVFQQLDTLVWTKNRPRTPMLQK